MKTYSIELLKRVELARDTYSFIFRKPNEFTFTAGQYVSLSVDPPHIAAPGGTMRELSVVSAPYESTIELALRFRDTPPKRQYLALAEGDTAFLQGPFGSFRLAKDERTVVMLAGGIGIVPFLSMIRQSLHDHENRRFFVFFSNRKQADIPYLPELSELASSTDQVTLITTLTSEKAESHESGYISSLLLKKYLSPLPTASYYISGPQRFVGGMWDVLGEIGVPDTEIHGEEFTGYE